jgi:hypothetical protein
MAHHVLPIKMLNSRAIGAFYIGNNIYSSGKIQRIIFKPSVLLIVNESPEILAMSHRHRFICLRYENYTPANTLHKSKNSITFSAAEWSQEGVVFADDVVVNIFY